MKKSFQISLNWQYLSSIGCMGCESATVIRTDMSRESINMHVIFFITGTSECGALRKLLCCCPYFIPCLLRLATWHSTTQATLWPLYGITEVCWLVERVHWGGFSHSSRWPAPWADLERDWYDYLQIMTGLPELAHPVNHRRHKKSAAAYSLSC